MKKLTIVAGLIFTALAGAQDCSVQAIKAANRLHELNGMRDLKVYSAKVFEVQKYSIVYEILSRDSDENRFVTEITTNKKCRIDKLEWLGET